MYLYRQLLYTLVHAQAVRSYLSRLPNPGSDNNHWGDILNDFLIQAHNPDGTLKDDTVGDNQLQTASVEETTLSSAVQTKLNQTAPVTKVNNKTGDVTLTKTDIGLSDVDNTADTAKPISTAQQTALDLKADASALAAKLNTADLDSQTATKITTNGTATQTALLSAYVPLPKPGQNPLTGWFHADGYGASPVASAATNTTAITNAITDAAGAPVYLPKGTYNHNGLTFPALTRIMGAGPLETILKCSVAATDSITITGGHGSIEKLGVWGNGSATWGTDATDGNGIVFAGTGTAAAWELTSVHSSYHGGDGIRAGYVSHNNDLHFTDLHVRRNKGHGVNAVAYKGANSQVNAISFKGCDISENGKSGFELWGNSISVLNTSIQANYEYGVELNGSLLDGTNSYTAQRVAIEQNHFEVNRLGMLHIRVGAGTANTFNKVYGLRVTKNYIFPGVGAQLDAGVLHMAKMTSAGQTMLSSHPVTQFEWTGNTFSADAGVGHLDGGGLMDGTNFIDDTTPTKFTGLTWARRTSGGSRKTIVLSNYFTAKATSVTFTLTSGRSSSITSNQQILYPLNLGGASVISGFGVYIDTDNTAGTQVQCTIYGRPKGSLAAYTTLKTIVATVITAGVISALADTAYLMDGYDDCYVMITVIPGTGGTYCYIYNPYLTAA